VADDGIVSSDPSPQKIVTILADADPGATGRR